MSAATSPNAIGRATDTYYVDCYGRRRFASDNSLVIEPTEGNGRQFGPADALALAEVKAMRYPVPHFPSATKGQDSNHRPKPQRPVISSPNVDFLPDLSKDDDLIRPRKDGRFYTGDFTLWPQWFFPATDYLPYVRARPPAHELATHPYRLAWYDLKRTDFLYEEGSAFTDIGRIRSDLCEEFTAMRKTLWNKVKLYKNTNPLEYHDNDFVNLSHAATGMLLSSVTLRCAPQSWNLTLLTVTSFQRYFLETLACFEYLNYFKRFSLETEEPHALRADVVGAVTHQLEVVQNLYMQGVLVWYVRRPEQLPLSTIIKAEGVPTVYAHMVSEYMEGVEPVYSGPASATRNRASQALRSGNIRLGHTSQPLYQPNPYHASNAQSQIPSLPGGPRWPQVAPSTSVVPTVSTGSHVLLTGTFLPSHKPGHQHNANKFQQPSVAWFPVAHGGWLDALQKVNKDWKLLKDHSDFDRLRGYPVFDPFVMTKTNPDLNTFWLILWLYIRSRWLVKTTSRQDNEAFPSPQDWKDYFLFVLGPALSIQDKAIVGPRKHSKADLEALFGLNIPSAQRVDLVWRKQRIACRVDVSQGLSMQQIGTRRVKEIIWDLCENNFRLELLAIDRCIHPRHLLTDQLAADRDALVLNCFPQNAYVVGDYPQEDAGLGAAKWEKRAPYVEAFRQVLVTWPGSKAGLLKNKVLVNPTEDQVLAVEGIAYGFYCQFFWDLFGRAATVPRILPA